MSQTLRCLCSLNAACLFWFFSILIVIFFLKFLPVMHIQAMFFYESLVGYNIFFEYCGLYRFWLLNNNTFALNAFVCRRSVFNFKMLVWLLYTKIRMIQNAQSQCDNRVSSIMWIFQQTTINLNTNHSFYLNLGSDFFGTPYFGQKCFKNIYQEIWIHL